ncbi:hypothetical protein FH972_017989 [Carpinus fangiana]|uniref:Uncharacterized protein n=1 Tax=Carpinus fangiana TaxID=176857 RepID=A0A5N6RPI7_9ROSI|nr:hypothetical protein FH972_017989 [Carpinus fangiana]
MEQFKGQPRLPKFAVPKRYDLRLKPDLSACKFAGSVDVDLDIVADTKYIVLNAADLSLVAGSVSFASRDFSKVLEPSKIDLVEADEILVLEFVETLPIGIGVLHIGFEGTLNDKMKGFYRRSLASYIKKYAYSNAKTEDLWAALEEGSGEPVNKLMNSWTKQKGYPVVSVNVKDQKLVFEQSQFLSSGAHGEGQWIVPITLCCGSYDVRKNFLLQTISETLDIKEFLSDRSGAASAWIKLNVDQAGFYRVKYDEDLAGRLRYAIESKYLSATDRFGILDDSFALCMARQQSLTSLLILMGAYREEVEYTVLSNLISISYKVARIVADASPELLNDIKRFFISLFQYSAEKLGWEPKQGESHLDAMLRGEILTALAVFGHDLTLNEASRRFHAFLDDRNTSLLPPDIRKAAYVGVMQRVSTSNRLDYESLLRVYRETDLSQEKTRILGSLASCSDPNIIREVLDFLLSSEVRSQDAVFGLAVSFEGRETAWTWLKEKWEYIAKTWGTGFLITRFVSAIVSPFASLEKAKEIEEYFANRSKPSIARTLKQSIERVHINANWVQSIQDEKHLANTVKELAHRKY